MRRQLAAVLAADICDYSRLMAEDGDATLAALRRLRAEVFGPAVASRRGRIVKSMGDGWIVRFDTASDAVSAAMAIQDDVARSKRPDEPQILLRIGLHLGDLVEEDEDVFGDCVNIAARLEAKSDPGAIAVSEAVFSGIDGTLRPSFDATGAWELKNIDWPIHVWVREAPALGASNAESSPRLNLAVRPVATSDQRPELRELADAITGDLSSYLNVAMWLQSTTLGQSDDAEYTLESRLRGSGDRLRLEARLLDASGNALLSERYDGALRDAFDWQDRVGEELAGRTISAVYDAEKSKLLRLDVEDMTADECLLRSQLEGHRLDADSIERSIHFARHALAKDPHSPDAMAQFILMFALQDDIAEEDQEELRHWLTAAEPYLTSHPMLDFLVTGLGKKMLGDLSSDWYPEHIDNCLRRAPRDFVMLLWAGWAYLFIGQPKNAMDCLHRSKKLGRNTPWGISIDNGLAMLHLQEGRYDKSIEYARAALAAGPDYPPPSRILAAALAQSGRLEEASDVIRHLLSIDPGTNMRKFQKLTPYAVTPESSRYLDGLRMAGMPE